MIKKPWQGLLEMVGILSVVVGLLLVAYEVRQANSIAKAQAVMELASWYNELNNARFTDSDFARLSNLLQDPDKHEISEVDASKIQGLAYYIHNIYWSAQTAYNSGLLSIDDLNVYRDELSLILKDTPGLVPDLVAIYESQPRKQDAHVFAPLAEMAAEPRGNQARTN